MFDIRKLSEIFQTIFPNSFLVLVPYIPVGVRSFSNTHVWSSKGMKDKDLEKGKLLVLQENCNDTGSCSLLGILFSSISVTFQQPEVSNVDNLGAWLSHRAFVPWIKYNFIPFFYVPINSCWESSKDTFPVMSISFSAWRKWNCNLAEIFISYVH